MPSLSQVEPVELDCLRAVHQDVDAACSAFDAQVLIASSHNYPAASPLLLFPASGAGVPHSVEEVYRIRTIVEILFRLLH